MTDTISIPLNKLVAWDGNVRRTGARTGVGELAASIGAHGLLQSLVVRKASRGKYAVVAGRRRLAALGALAESGQLERDAPIACRVIDGGADAAEISLAENVVREPMHPADEFEAFNALVEAGMPAADVAARFGVTETVVLQRLKLARVSPALIAAYRAGEITLQHVMAFAASDDHAAQERVWAELADWQREDPQTIRDALTDGEIPATDRRVRFVTLEAYEQAGGPVRRDLFTEGEDGIFILDPLILNGLVLRKLEAEAQSIRAEGWKWVEIRDPFDYSEWSHCERRHPEQRPLSAEEQAELEQLSADQEQCWERTDDEEAIARLDEIEPRIAALEHRESFWPAGTLAIAGAIVCLDHAGVVEARRGYVLPDDAPPKSRRTATRSASASETGTDAGTIPASLTESLSAHRSAAISAILTEQPRIALAVAVHALALRVLFDTGQAVSARISATPALLRHAEGSKALAELERHRATWTERLPGDPEALWTWCLAQGEFALLDLLAYCVAMTIDAVERKQAPDGGRLAHADAVAAALSLDMGAWFTPTAENFFGRITKPQIIAALQEAKGTPPAPAWAGMKKSELANLAEREIAGTGWLPALLRNRE